MKFRSSFVVALLAFPLTTLCAQADEAKPPNYILFAIKTALQRELLFSTRADAYAQVDVAACVHERKFDLKRFDRDGFQKALAALAHQSRSPKNRRATFTSTCVWLAAQVSISPARTSFRFDKRKRIASGRSSAGISHLQCAGCLLRDAVESLVQLL